MADGIGTNGIAAVGVVTAVAWGNLAAIFALELAALGALGYAVSRGGAPLAVRVALGVGVALVAAVMWGLFAAPNATFQNTAAMIAVKVLVFGGASVGLVLAGHRTLGLAFAVAVVLTAVLAHALPTPGTTSTARTVRTVQIPAGADVSAGHGDPAGGGLPTEK